MSWRDSLRPGSFRGAVFAVQASDTEGGRRGELHEYPERDKPWFEDLGRKAKRWTIEAIVVGADYMAKRDALDRACEERGAGTLIHPFLGEINVVSLTHRYRETTAEGGAAVFTIEFAEPGEPISTGALVDTVAESRSIADFAQAISPLRFAALFSIAGMPAFVEASAVNQLRGLVDAAVGIAGPLGGTGIALRTFESGLSVLPSGATALVRTPLSLGHAVAGMVMAVAGLSASPNARVRALRRMMDPGLRLPPFITRTVARRREQSNAHAFRRLIATLSSAEAVRAASAIRFTSYDEAVQVRDALAQDIDAVALEAADAGDDANSTTLDELRLAMVRDVTARGGSLDRLYGYTPAVTEPALSIAQRLHGAPEVVVDRADELVERNRIAHPGFVPGGRPLQVRTLTSQALSGTHG